MTAPVAAPGPLVSCTSLVKIYQARSGPVQALRGVDLTVEQGAGLAVVGPSGSGKSSLLRIVAGLEEPTAGTVTVAGVELARAGRRRRRALRVELLSHVYQRPTDNLMGHLTARQQVERVAVHRGSPPDAAIGVLEVVGLGHRLDHRPHELSGGEQQRLAFARAAVGEPRLVIADEPTAELDSASSRLVLDTIDHLVALGITVIVASHDPQTIERADQVVTLRDGTVATVRRNGETLAVVDRAGRLQLPPQHQRQFAAGRARLSWDRDAQRLMVEPAGEAVAPITAGDEPTSDGPATDETDRVEPAPVSGGRTGRVATGAVVEVAGLVKSYQRSAELVHAVRRASFRLRPGTITVLAGPSGSGKTTLLNLLLGWERPDAGAIDGLPPRPTWADLAVVPQALGLLSTLTVAENVSLPLRVVGRGHDPAGLLPALDIARLADRFPEETSLGEQQRTAIARALVTAPDLLVLDEPTSHQDEEHTVVILRQLTRAAAEGATLLIATHDDRIVAAADQLLGIEDGTVTVVG